MTDGRVLPSLSRARFSFAVILVAATGIQIFTQRRAPHYSRLPARTIAWIPAFGENDGRGRGWGGSFPRVFLSLSFPCKRESRIILNRYSESRLSKALHDQPDARPLALDISSSCRRPCCAFWCVGTASRNNDKDADHVVPLDCLSQQSLPQEACRKNYNAFCSSFFNKLFFHFNLHHPAHIPNTALRQFHNPARHSQGRHIRHP